MPPKSKSTKKKSPPVRAKKKAIGYPAKALLAALLLSGFLIVSLVLLSQFGDRWRTVPPASVEQSPVRTEDVRVEIDSLLLRAGIPLTSVHPLDGPGLLVQAPVPDDPALEGLQRRLRRLEPGLRLDLRQTTGTLHVLRGDETLFFVRFQPPEKGEAPASAAAPSTPPSVSPPVGKRPRLAIIMDDLGRDMATGRALVALGIPITFSILPIEANAVRVAELAHRHGREVLIHIPMEPQGYPLVDPGEDALFVEHSTDEIRERMRGFIARIPHAVGGNNHMGSRFTESAQGMKTVLEVMRETDLFFVDSVTTPRSIAYKEARLAGIPAAVRHVFLDNVVEEGAIASQMEKLTALALRQGHAIGICHPYPATLAVLRRQVVELEKLGIEVVPVSRLLVR